MFGKFRSKPPAENPPRKEPKWKDLRDNAVDAEFTEIPPEAPPQEPSPAPEAVPESSAPVSEGPVVWDSSLTTGRLESAENQFKELGPKALREKLSSIVKKIQSMPDERLAASQQVPNSERPKTGTAEKVAEKPGMTEERKAQLAKEAGGAVEQKRNEMRTAETAYLSAYKDFYANNNALSRLGKKALGREEVVGLKELKDAYDKARLSYADELSDVALRRLGKAGYERGKADKITERYNRLVRYNEVIRPATEKLLQARVEALGEKGQNVFEKSISYFSRGNKQLEEKVGVLGARVIRAGVGAIAITVPAALIGSFGAAGIMAIAGYGSYRFMKSLTVSSIGVIAGESLGKMYEKFRGRSVLEAAQESLKTAGRTGGSLTADDLHAFDKTRAKLKTRSSEQNLAQKRAIIKAFTAFGFGAGASAALAEYSSIQEVFTAAGYTPDTAETRVTSASAVAPETSASPSISLDPEKGFKSSYDKATEEMNAAIHEQLKVDATPVTSASPAMSTPEVVPEASLKVPESPAATVTPEAASAVPEASTPAGDRLKIEIGGNIDSADQMWRAAQRALASSAGTDSALIQHILNTDPHKLSIEYGFAGPNQSAWMHDGDQLKISDTGEVMFVPKNGEPITLARVTPAGEYTNVQQYEGPRQTHIPEAEKPVESVAPVAPTGPAVPEPVAPPAAPPPPEPVAPPVAEVPAAAPASIPDTSSAAEAAPETEQPAVTTPEATPNMHGLVIEQQTSHVYADKEGHLIIHGGEMKDRFTLASDYVMKNPNAHVYFDSSETDPITGQVRVHLSHAYWNEATKSVQIWNESVDPSIKGWAVPTADALYRKVQ